jgi:CSLREA domain-containing protein
MVFRVASLFSAINLRSSLRTAGIKAFRLPLLAAAAMLCLGGVRAHAASTWTVDTLSDDSTTSQTTAQTNCQSGNSSTCALRDAILASGSGGTIQFSVTGTITLSSALPQINASVTIQGPAANSLTVSGNNAYQVFNIGSGATVTISGLTIANGSDGRGSGGGIANAGTLTLSNSTFSGNSAFVDGGGIWSSGSLTVQNSTFTGNSAADGGGIYNIGSMTVTDSTFSGNSASAGGGGIYAIQGLVANSAFRDNSATSGGGIVNYEGTITVTNSTFSGNSAVAGGGILNVVDSSSTVINSTFSGNFATGTGVDGGGGIANAGTLAANNNIFTGNTAAAAHGGGIYNRSGTTTASYNVFYNNLAAGSEDDCGNCTPTNSTTGNPNLLPLGYYGGTTETMALAPGSAAICAGLAADVPNGVSTDQRGFALDATCASGFVDAGAVQTNQYVVTTLTDVTDGSPACTTGIGTTCSLRDAISLANTTPGDITFKSSLTSVATPGTINLHTGTNTSLPALSGQTNILGPGANQLTVSGGSAVAVGSVFTVNSGATVLLYGLTVSNGRSSTSGGGIKNSGSLTVDESVVSNNLSEAASLSGGGGGIYNIGSLLLVDSTVSGNSVVDGGGVYSDGTLEIVESTVYGNTAAYHGGGIAMFGGSAVIVNSTIAGNMQTEPSFDSGGIYDTGSLTLTNSIVSGNTAAGTHPNVDFYSGTGNVIGGETNSTNSLVGGNGANITLSPLQLNGIGATVPTMIPLPGSPAICAGLSSNIPSGTTTDERGYPNTNTTYTGYSSGSPCVDAGAVQTNYTSAAFVQQPTDTATNSNISPSPTVEVLETDTLLSSNNTDAVGGIQVTVTPSGGTYAGSPFSATTSSTSPFLATFSSLDSSTSASGIDLVTSAITVVGSNTLGPVQSNTYNVGGSATHFSVSAPPAATAGTPFSITVTALDAGNNTATGYTGTVSFTESDNGAASSIPGNYTFVSADNGVHTFTNSVTLVTAGAQTVTATDTVTGSITGTSSNIYVSPGTATQVVFKTMPSSTATAGVAFATQPVVAIEDQYGNVETSDSTDTVTAARGSLGTAALQGASLTVTVSNGVATFSGLSYDKAETLNISATSNQPIPSATSSNIVVSPNIGSQLAVSGYPTTWYAGATAQISVDEVDQYGNVLENFLGPVTVTTSDSAATVTQFSSYYLGVVSYSVVFNTQGPQSITVTSGSLPSASETGIQIGPMPSFVVTVATDTTDGQDTSSDCTNQSLPGATPDASCSLRDAAWAADYLGAGNITFSPTVFNAPTTITLSAPTNSGNDFGAVGIGANTTLTGPTGSGGSVNLVTVSGATPAPPSTGSAVFFVYGSPYSPTLIGPDTIANLNIVNGDGSAATGDNSGTGGISSEAPTFTLSNCNFTGNNGDLAGALYNYSGQVTVTGGSFSSNTATGVYEPSSAAIFSDTSTGTPKFVKNHSFASKQNGAPAAITEASNSTATLKPGFYGTTIGGRAGFASRVRIMSAHQSSAQCAGCASAHAGNSSLLTSQLSVLPESSGSGAPLSLPSLTVTNTTFTSNQGGATGAVFDAGDLVSITNSTFLNNTANDGGGALVAYEGGEVTVSDSTFSGNTGSVAGVAFGINGGQFQVQGSTLSGNVSTGGGGIPIPDAGGVVVYGDSYAFLAYDTIVNNSSTSGTGIGAIADFGSTDSFVAAFNLTVTGNSGFYGAMLDDSGDESDLENTIASGNTTTDPNAATDGTSPDSNGMMQYGPNLITSPYANLSAPGNYGGPTQTMLPDPGSQAICGGSEADLANAYTYYGITLTTDQRGYPNTNSTYLLFGGGTCVDAGAVQTNYALSFTTPPPASVSVGQVISPAPVVSLTESTLPFGAASASVNMTDSANLLSGTTSEALSAGAASFNDLVISAPASNDLLFASMPLNAVVLIDAQAPAGISATAIPATLSPSSGTLSTSQNFTWNNGAGPTLYQLLLGTSGPVSSDLYNSGPTTSTSATVTIPSYGVTVFATLRQLINGTWQSSAYTFTELGTPTPATLSPSSGLLSTGQTFTWSNGAGPARYQLQLGTSGFGSTDILSTPDTTATTASVTIPSNGVNVYATFYQLIDGAWQKSEYTFIEPGSPTPATLSPSSGTLAASQTFTWNNGIGPSQYQLLLGTSGPDSSDLYSSGATTRTSATVAIPSYGVTVFATLKQLINGVWQSTAYTFVELGTPTPATLSPSSGTLSASQTFTWNNGAGPSKYQLQLGTAGFGSTDILSTPDTTATTVTVSIPSNGVNVYATFYQLINGAWQKSEYTFIEPGTPTPATLTPSSGMLSDTQTFTWSNGAGPARYQLQLGTSGFGSTDILSTPDTTATTVTVSIPSNGVTVYAAFYQLINDTWQKSEYTFTEPGSPTQATLSPSSGLLSTSQAFTWSNGAGPSQYQLLLGTSGPDSSDLYNSGATTRTSANVTIPSYGVTVFATLKQLISGAWQSTAYTFTEPGTPTLATLSPSSGVLATSQTFTWSNGAGPARYMLQLGTSGFGSTDLFHTPDTTATTATVSIPSNGVTVYATFYQLIDGAWQRSEYTFTESTPLSCSSGISGTSLSAFTGTQTTGWDFNGNAYYDSTANTATLVDSSSTPEAGTVIYQNPITVDTFTVSFDFLFNVSNGRADGLAFMLETNGPSAVGQAYSGLGDLGLTGYGMGLNIFDSGPCTPGDSNYAGIYQLSPCSTNAGVSTPIASSGDLYTAVGDIGDGTWRTATIEFSSGQMSVAITPSGGGIPVNIPNLQNVTLPGFTSGTSYYFGFSAGTGSSSLYSSAQIENVSVTFPTARCL